MSVFGPTKWEINALVTISSQLMLIERKLDILLKKFGEDKELSDLAVKLNTSTTSLENAVEKNKPKGKK